MVSKKKKKKKNEKKDTRYENNSYICRVKN